LIAAIPEERYRLAAAWLFWTGCRVSEACDATHQDVRLREEAGLYEWSIPDSKTHIPRKVWLPGELAKRLESSRSVNKPRPEWPVLWDCAGTGFARVEDPSCPISPRTINSALERAREAAGLPARVTAHVAKHSYCTNWIRQYGDSELAMEKLSRQVGTSPAVLRDTYVHIVIDDSDWGQIQDFGAPGA
jgi:integrase